MEFRDLVHLTHIIFFLKLSNMKTKLALMAAIFSCSITLSASAQSDLIAKNNLPQRIDLSVQGKSHSAIVFNAADFHMRQKSIEHWKKLKRMGIITTGLGVGCFIGGVAMVATEANDPYYNENDPSATAAAGALGIVGSVPAVLGGITMWVIGGVNNAKMKKAGFSISNTKDGMGIVYKF